MAAACRREMKLYWRRRGGISRWHAARADAVNLKALRGEVEVF